MRKSFILTPLFVIFFTGATPNSSGPKVASHKPMGTFTIVAIKVDSVNIKAEELKKLMKQL